MLFVFIAYFAHVLENTLIAYVVKEAGPFVCILIFYLISTVFVFGYDKLVNHRKPKVSLDKALILKHKGSLIAYISGAFLGNSLWFMSIFLIGVGMVSFILIFIRLFVAVYAYAFMNDRYPIDKVVAFGTAFVALCFYSYEGLENNWLGITLALISCLAFSAESIGKKKLALSGLKPENMVLWRYSILSLLFLIIFSGLVLFNVLPEEMVGWPSLKVMSILCVASFFGAVCTNIALFYGLRTVALSTLESLNSTKPVLFSVIGLTFLNETITSNQLIWGIVIILSSLYFITPKRNLKEGQKS